MKTYKLACPACGGPCHETSTQCPYCGTGILIEFDERRFMFTQLPPIEPPHTVEAETTPKVKPPKSWALTFLLCITLGPFGAHRFYSGHKTIGILQLLTLGGFGLWWMVDMFLLVINQYRDSDGRPLIGYTKWLVIGYLIFGLLVTLMSRTTGG